MALPVTFGGTAGSDITTEGFNKLSGDTGSVVISGAARCRPGSTASSVQYTWPTDLPPSADYDVEVDFINLATSKTQRFGIIGRASSTARTFYLLRINHIAFDTNSNLQLYKAVSGTFTQLGSNFAFAASGASGTLRLSMSGTSIKGFIDGVERISATDSAISSAGRIGIYNTADDTITNSDGYHFDNLTASFAGAGGLSIPVAINNLRLQGIL